MVKRIPVHITLTGDYRADVRKIQITLAQIEEGMEPALERDLVDAAQNMRDWARAFAPYDTGSLRQSIRVEHVARLAVRIRAGGYVTNPKTGRLVDYAWYVEEGTDRMPPKPFMRPAWSMTRRYVEQRVEASMRRLASSV